MRNPYHFGSPALEGHFTDRVRELEQLRSVMLNGQNAILIAPRRFGKSSLLSRAIDQVRAAGGRSGKVSLMKCSTEQEVAEELMRGVLEGPAGWLRGHVEELVERLRRVRIQPELVFEEGQVRGIRLGAMSTTLEWRETIARVIRLLGELGDEAHPVSLVIDEYQRAYEIAPAIPAMTKDLIDELPRVSLVLAGSKRHLMEEITRDPDTSPLYHVGAKLYLEKISRGEFAAYLVGRAEAGGKRMSLEVAELVYDLANGIPNDVQLLSYWAWDRAGRRITEDDVLEALHQAVADQKQEYETIFDRLATTQQLLLKLLAAEPLENLTALAVTQRLGVTHGAVRKAAEVLQRQELIAREEDGRWAVFSGLFRQWLVGDY